MGFFGGLFQEITGIGAGNKSNSSSSSHGGSHSKPFRLTDDQIKLWITRENLPTLYDNKELIQETLRHARGSDGMITDHHIRKHIRHLVNSGEITNREMPDRVADLIDRKRHQN